MQHNAIQCVTEKAEDIRKTSLAEIAGNEAICKVEIELRHSDMRPSNTDETAMSLPNKVRI